VARGAVAALETAPPFELSSLKRGYSGWVGGRCQGQNLQAKTCDAGSGLSHRIYREVIDASTLEISPEIGRCLCWPARGRELTLHTRKLSLRCPCRDRAHRALVIVDGFDVSGGESLRGITTAAYHDSATKSNNIYGATASHVAQRESGTLNRGCVYGSPVFRARANPPSRPNSSGTFQPGRHAYVLDGDNIATDSDRTSGSRLRIDGEYRRIGEVASCLLTLA